MQSFEVGNLQNLDRELRVPLVQLLGAPAQKPWDFVVSGDPRTYARHGHAGRAARHRRVRGRRRARRRTTSSRVTPPATRCRRPRSSRDAHRAGLLVHPYTFRNENSFLPLELRSSPDPAAYGNAAAEYEQFFDLGVDGLFSDNADTAVRARGGGKPGRGEAQLLARAILPSDAYQPGPPSGAARHAGQRRHAAVPRSADPGLLGGAQGPGGHVLRDARQRLRRQDELGRLPAPALPDPARTSRPTAGAAAGSTCSASSSCAIPTTRSTSRSRGPIGC